MSRRDPIDVIYRMMTYCPTGNFKSALRRLLKMAAFSCPECDGHIWQELSRTVARHLETPEKRWHIEVLAVFGRRHVGRLEVLFEELDV